VWPSAIRRLEIHGIIKLCLWLFKYKTMKNLGSGSRGQLKCDGTCAETRFHLSAKRTSPFKSAGASVQSTTGSQGVRIGGSNAGYTMFRGSVKGTGYPLHSPVSPSLPFPCVTVCHHIQLESTSLRVGSFGTRPRRVVSPTLRRPYPARKNLGGPQIWSGRFRELVHICDCRESNR